MVLVNRHTSQPFLLLDLRTYTWSQGNLIVHDFFMRLQPENLPALHQSAKYEEVYRPAYWVIALEFFTLG
jgi:hypothetical protein